MKKITSTQFTLKLRDLGIGLFMSIGAPLLYAAQEFIPSWDVNPFIKIGIAAGITYLLKNFFEPSKEVTITTPKDEKN